MRKLSIFLIVALVATFFAFTPDGKEVKTLQIGEQAPRIDLNLKATTGEETMVRTMMGGKGLLVVFSCNTCPFVVAWEDRYNELYDLAEANGIEMVLVNSNEAKREGDDSPKEMEKHAKKLDYKAPYLIDENSALANAWGAKTTPHVYLFDASFRLQYEGAIDDNYKSKDEVTSTYLKDALENLAKGEKINPANTKALGCSIKRVG